MHCFSVFFVAFTEVIVRRILIINNAMKVSSKSLSGGLLPPDVPTVDKLDLGLVLIRKSECESLMIPAFILLNITPAVWTLGAWQWPRVCMVLGISRKSIVGVNSCRVLDPPRPSYNCSLQESHHSV